MLPKRILLFIYYFLCICLIVGASSKPKSAFAHPLDEIGDVNVYDQKQTLTVSPNNVGLTIELTFYAFEKIKVWESIDVNKDKQLTNSEKENWMRLGQGSSWIEKDNQKFLFDANSVDVPDYYDFFAPDPVNITIKFNSDIKLVSEDTLFYSYDGKDKKLSEITFEAKGSNGLGVTEVVPLSDNSKKLLLSANSEDAFVVSGLDRNERLDKFLNNYVKPEKVPPVLMIVALAASFLIGMLHALTPGHGKAIVAGYLVGEKGTIWHAVQLGVIITITHTASVILLGLGTLLLTEYVVPSIVIKIMNILSGTLITLIGIYLLIIRVKKFNSKISTDHLHTHPHPHNHLDAHSNEHHQHEELAISWKNLIPLGVSGGIVPCVDALAILIVAISLGKTVLGLTLLVFFSFGLASALIAGGIIVVFAKNKTFTKIEKLSKYERYISIASALIVIILGLLLLIGKLV